VNALQSHTKIFHFQEIDWTISFPPQGNEGKYCNYNVTLKKGTSQPETPAKLGEVLENPEFERNCPHTVGYYKMSSAEGENSKPAYLELRTIKTIEEFWLFLNSLDI
jgi:hypothetical protein